MSAVFIRKHFLFLCICLLSKFSFSQQSISENSVVTDFNNALKLYNNKAYTAAQKKFATVENAAINNSNLKSDASYYEAMSAIKLRQTDADKKVLKFVEENPNSNKKNKAYYNVANYYFANKRASYALKWYQKVALDGLSKENTNELNYKMGYCFLVTKNYTLAKDKFLLLINDAKYGNDSRYYYGYIAYKLEDYGIAESTLKEIENNETYKQEISYYLLDINFKAGNFERCVLIGKELLIDAKRKQLSEISKIIGESYFNLKKYAESIPYLIAFKGKNKKWSNTDYYQLGYAYYKQNDFINAINNFNKIIEEKNKISQNAYSHLGECYLKIDQKTEALNAFKSASEMNFDLQIKQDAALNYAKLSYEEGNPFKSVADVLQDYLRQYPKSKEYDQINELVISSYLHQQNYEGALAFLSKKKSKENIALSQEVSLYRGMQLFNENKLKEAIPFFTTGAISEDKEISNMAKYWEAEALYRLENYKEALSKFNFLSTSVDKNTKDTHLKQISYNIGYSNFKLKNYKEAADSFSSFLKTDSINDFTKDDALIRMGDSYFASKNYKSAINSYTKVIDKQGANADYAEYQVGMIYGFTGDNLKKVIALKNVVNNYTISTLKDDALFNIASTQTTLKNTQEALNAYNRLLDKYPTSIFTSKALVRQGLLFYNDNQGDKALERYKQVARQFPNSPDALEAVANARNVYIDKGNLDDYVKWISSLKFINISNSDLDNTTFAVAEKQYFESKDGNLIIKNLTNYVNGFPDGVHKLKANYYLADVLFKVKEFKRAIAYYEVVIDEEQNEFSEE
ncbi:MAG: tetratricopeptide repeat protein, partial [Polaribacter sp.]